MSKTSLPQRMAGINSRELQEVLVLQVKLPAKGGEVKKKQQQRRVDGSIPGGCWKSSAPLSDPVSELKYL